MNATSSRPKRRRADAAVSPRRRRRHAVAPFAAPEETATVAALRYAGDDSPGISRKHAGRAFSYRDAAGHLIRDKATLGRIRTLAIPPAWTDVWISPLQNGHIQATGRDARGRKQYRYHPRWNAVRAETKYERMLTFGAALPQIRDRIRIDLARPGIPKEKVLAMVVRLLESTFIRVGNEEYARTNKSFGLTTMKDRHVEIDGTQIRFRFRGKSGKTHDVELTDRRLARLVKQCRDLPGQDLFQYVGDDGEPHPIDSAAVNEYIREISGQEFTAKDFRTWAGSLLAARQLHATHPIADEAGRKGIRVATIAAVAAQLGNTVAVCRKCYIHPSVLAAFDDRALFDRWIGESTRTDAAAGLEPDEAALLRFLDATPVMASQGS
jgi:DNA topoisomerase I